MTTRARPYLGYASACLLFLFIYPQLQGLPRLIPINASQKLFDALAIAGPIFWFLRRSSPKASAMIGFVMGATLLVWLLRRRLHLDTSIFTSWEAAVPIAMASLVKSPDRDDIVATGHIISIGVFALGLSIIALLAPPSSASRKWRWRSDFSLWPSLHCIGLRELRTAPHSRTKSVVGLSI